MVKLSASANKNAGDIVGATEGFPVSTLSFEGLFYVFLRVSVSTICLLECSFVAPKLDADAYGLSWWGSHFPSIAGRVARMKGSETVGY
jgi:hypothetical protein